MNNSIKTCSKIFGVYKKNFTKDEHHELQQKLSSLFLNAGILKFSIVKDINHIILYSMYENEYIFSDNNTDGSYIFSIDNNFINSNLNPDFGLYKINKSSWAQATVHGSFGISLSKDIAGTLPFFYALIKEKLFFSSSINFFNVLPLSIDKNSVLDFLHYLYIPSPRTIYNEVKSLMPGQIIFFDGRKMYNDNIGSEAFQDNKANTHQSKKIENLLNNYERLLINSVESSIPENSKASLFLSGGKDSSSLAVAMKLSGAINPEMVTIGFEEPEIDESQDAAAVAQHLGFPINKIFIKSKNCSEYWQEFIRCLDQPIGDPAALPVFIGFKELKNRFDIIIDGTGNDRYFGVPTTWQQDLTWYIHRKFPMISKMPWHLLRNRHSYSLNTIANYLSIKKEEQFVSWNGWNYNELMNLTGMAPNWENIPLFIGYPQCTSPMKHKTFTLCNIWEPETAYPKVVYIAKHFDKLVRYPYLNNELVEFSQNLPTGLQYKKRINKIILRLFMEKYLPKEIINKKKGSFIFPKKYILDTNNYEVLNFFLSSDCIKRFGLVDHQVATSFIDHYKAGNQQLEDRIWALLVLHSWAELSLNQ